MSNKRIKRRVPKTVQMVVGQDDDLIAWFSGLKSGEVNKQIKAALRAGLGLTPPARNVEKADALDVRMLKQIMDTEFANVYSWVEYLKNLGISSSQTQSNPVYEQQPLIDDAELQERESKLLNMGW